MSEVPHNCPKCGHRMDEHREAEAVGYACWHLTSPCHKSSGEFCGCQYIHTEPPPEPLATFYAVRNEQGQYYRTYSQRGSSAGWVDRLEDARLWTRSGPAKGKITALCNEKPKLPVPELIEFRVTEVHVVDQSVRIVGTREKKRQEETAAQARVQQMLIDQAEYEIKQARTKLKKLRGE